MDYTIYHRRKPRSEWDRPVLYVRFRIGGVLIRKSCRTRIQLSAEQAARAWLKHFKRKLS